MRAVPYFWDCGVTIHPTNQTQHPHCTPRLSPRQCEPSWSHTCLSLALIPLVTSRPSLLMCPRSLSGMWAHPCPTVSLLCPGGLENLFTDPTNYHMIFVLTHMVPTITFQKHTHSEIIGAQTRLTVEFSNDV